VLLESNLSHVITVVEKKVTLPDLLFSILTSVPLKAPGVSFFLFFFYFMGSPSSSSYFYLSRRGDCKLTCYQHSNSRDLRYLQRVWFSRLELSIVSILQYKVLEKISLIYSREDPLSYRDNILGRSINMLLDM
jgi:hypothetical protein